MSKITNALTLEQANGKLEAIESRRATLAAMAAQTGNELADAEAALGEAVLAGDDGAVLRVSGLRLQADGLSAALSALERRRAAALLDQRRAEAADLRHQAQMKRDELAGLERKTAAHLKALSELEGVAYDASILSSQRAGAWLSHTGGVRSPDPWAGLSEGYPDPTNAAPLACPRSRRLREEIPALEQKAAAIEAELGPGPEAAAA